MSNLGFYYLADYYTETEALDRALEVAKEIQEEIFLLGGICGGLSEGL